MFEFRPSPKLRFAVTVGRQIFTVLDMLMAPTKRPARQRRRRSHREVIMRLLLVCLSLLRILWAWRELRRAEKGPRRRRVRKPYSERKPPKNIRRK